MTTTRALPRAAALLTAGAAAIHLGVAGSHFAEWWASGLFFLIAAAGQGVWAVAAWTRPPARRMLNTGAAMNTSLIAVWLLSRTAGLPIGPGGGIPEAVGAADLITVAMEGLATLAIAAQLWAPSAGARIVGSGARRASLLGAAVAAAVLVASGVALAEPEPGHAATTSHEHGQLDGAATGETPGDLSSHPEIAGTRHGHPNLPDTSAATPEQTAGAEELLAHTIASTAAYRDLAAARAAGYDVKRAWDRRTALLAKRGRTPKAGRAQLVHVPNRAYRTDGRILDPARPETLVYARTAEGEFVLVGVMFTAEHREPPASYQPYVRWHTHTFCRGGDVGKLRPVDGVCADGTVLAESGAMTHLWFVDRKDLAYAFAMTPPRDQMTAYQKSVARG